MRRRSLLAAGTAALLPRPAPGQGVEAGEPVDVLLVLAVDVSRSVDEDEARLQREGYRNAVSDPQVVEAIRGGMIGAVGLAYVEWAGAEYQRLVLPWARIAGQGDALAWAEKLAEAPRASLSWTSISAALDFSRTVLAQAPFDAARRVIDVSGDGVNNSGGAVEVARDRLVAEGVTINGLPIVNDRPTFGRMPPIPLDDYFRESVIGGAGAFVIVAEDFASFGNAVKRKLIREIAMLGGPTVG
ncbi:DUF1194 domain-containing protein [Siccirubricoccus deserti]|uniref:DUF1194 domain-containing protein n=1 Tax=Siccirubricoccus deserti TaxID=2013562 RepID=A0A9X0QUV8_9PROT|nr:DUF1194 domain-containing protein [Siccirubricoccus deserti]MBC4013860.1 DUF1194 domain-containing protein [Siccirubricoccus deserti]